MAIKTIPLWKSRSLSAGDKSTSDKIDLRYITQGIFSLHSKVQAGTSTTLGTTGFRYIGCTIENGDYIAPDSTGYGGTICTNGPAIDLDTFKVFGPEPMPFMKIVVEQSGAGTAGANSVITAELVIG